MSAMSSTEMRLASQIRTSSHPLAEFPVRVQCRYATGGGRAGHAVTRTRPRYRRLLQIITTPSQPDDPIISSWSADDVFAFVLSIPHASIYAKVRYPPMLSGYIF